MFGSKCLSINLQLGSWNFAAGLLPLSLRTLERSGTDSGRGDLACGREFSQFIQKVFDWVKVKSSVQAGQRKTMYY